MVSPRWTKVFRDLTSNWVRTLLVVLSIGVGVYAVAVVMGGRGVLIREFDSDYAASVPPSAEMWTSDFDEPVAQRLAEREDVLAAEARREVGVRYTSDDVVEDQTTGWASMRLWALPEFRRTGVLKIVREETLSWPPKAGEIILEKSALQVAGFSVGETVTVEVASGKMLELRIAGFAHDINAIPAQFLGSETGFISTETLELLEEPDSMNYLSLKLDSTLSRSSASRIAVDVRDTDLAAAGVRVLSLNVPEPGSHFLGDIFKAIVLLLLAMGVLSLALSGFLVVTTMQAIMAQQVRQVGIMKAVGGQRMQIARMYLIMVVVYGMFGSVIGIAAGLWTGRSLIEYAAGVLNFRVVDYFPPLWILLLDMGVGIVVPLLAASAPIHLGTTMPVVKALNSANTLPNFGHGLVDRLLGLIRGLPRPVALSLRNTFLRKGRLALTLTTLILASMVVMSVWSVRASTLQTSEDLGTRWNYDAQVFMARPQPRAELEREASKIDGVAYVETWVEGAATVARQDGTQDARALGVPVDTRVIRKNLLSGEWLSNAKPQGVVVNTDITKALPNLGVGDNVRLTIAGEEEDFTVLGVTSSQLMGAVIYFNRDRLDSALGGTGSVSRMLVQTGRHDADTQARTADELERRLDDANLPISGTLTQFDQKTRLADQLNILVTFLAIMAGLLAAVGVIGLTGTMTINVLESTREIGVMRSIGASHGSIFGIYITEGVVIAVMAWAIGAVLSYPFSIWLTDALGKAMSLPLSYTFSWSGIGIWFAAMTGIAVVASLLPSWRASQVSIRDAIAHE